MIPASAKKNNTKLSHGGQCFLHISARLRPVTEPSLTHKDCRKIAMMFEVRIMTSRRKRYVEPAATSVA